MQWLGFTGDVMVGRLVADSQKDRSPEALWGDVLPELQALDGLAIDLNCCLSTRGTPWTRTHKPFHFRGDPEVAIPALEAAGVDYASLANDHLLDYGEPALVDTLDALAEAEIAHAGAGRTEREAHAPAVVSVGDLEVAVVSLTDAAPEYAAGAEDPGVAHVRMDPDRESELDRVRETLDRARASDPDLLVASLHWGNSMVVEPSETHEAFGRWLIEQGVDFVHGHGAGIVQGIEVHDGGVVCYDTGSFVDDYAVDGGLRNDLSFLFVAGVEAGSVRRLELHPVVIEDCAVGRAEDQDADLIRDTVRRRSEPYGTEFQRDGDALVIDGP